MCVCAFPHHLPYLDVHANLLDAQKHERDERRNGHHSPAAVAPQGEGHVGEPESLMGEEWWGEGLGVRDLRSA